MYEAKEQVSAVGCVHTYKLLEGLPEQVTSEQRACRGMCQLLLCKSGSHRSAENFLACLFTEEKRGPVWLRLCESKGEGLRMKSEK